MKLHSPFQRCHELAGARFLDWGGWQLPAVYSSTEEEVHTVRTAVGYAEFPFLSHMVVEGPDALAALQRGCSRNLESCAPGRGVYTLMLNDDGSVADDGMVFRLSSERFIVSVPGPNPRSLPPATGFQRLKEPKLWLRRVHEGRLCIHEMNAFVLVVQGPLSMEMLRPVVDFADLPLRAIREVKVGNVPALCARTGFTGEAGVEFFVWPEYAIDLWETVAALGRSQNAVPYGIQCTLTLGIEKGFLNANDFYQGATPFELGVSWLVAMDKPEFVGRQALVQRRSDGIRSKLVGIELRAEAVTPLAGQALLFEGEVVGAVTNAAFSPTLRKTLVRGWLPVELTAAGTPVTVLVHGLPSRGTVAESYRWYDPENTRL